MKKIDTKQKLEFVVTDDLLNYNHTLHGGEFFKKMDQAAGECSVHFCNTKTMTKAVNNFTYVKPAMLGDTVTVMAIVDYAGTTSMEVYVKASVEDQLLASGYFTMVAVSPDLKPMKVPKLELETSDDYLYYEHAKKRRVLYRELEEIKRSETL